MSEIVFTKKSLKGSPLNGQDEFPILRKQMMFEKEAHLDEDDGLFINYGKLMNVLPYQYQGSYGTELVDMEFDSVVLENENLRAEFVPALGGRLWSLYDKKARENLVIDNPVFRPRNLALRNAWFSGGVEWNIGIRGHSPLTCEQMFVARLKAQDGTPVLRLYQFERVRAVVYQMDFFLPDASRFLFARMRIVNDKSFVVPMYWWSTIAVEQKEGSRIIVPADESYINQGSEPVYKTAVPYIDGKDISYPTNNDICVDYFYNIPDKSRKYIANLDADGYGLVQTSTKKLTGRKLFVWGLSQGGKHWQKFLTSDKGHDYAEIQAGLARTQNECLPMPPKTAWEWLEAYGPITLDKSVTHGDWQGAKAGVEDYLSSELPEDHLENLLRETKKTIALVKGETVAHGESWAALENLLRRKNGVKPLPEHLSYGKTGAAQKYWNSLLEFGFLEARSPDEVIPSYMVQDEWFDLLKKAAADHGNWQTHYHLGVCHYHREDNGLALEEFNKSLSLAESVWAIHGLANTYRVMGSGEKASMCFAKACAMKPSDAGLFKEALRVMAEAVKYELMLSTVSLYSGKPSGLIDFYKAYALAYTDRLEEASELLTADLDIPDYREGDDIITDLYQFVMSRKTSPGDSSGKTIDRQSIEVPPGLDFRMFYKG